MDLSPLSPDERDEYTSMLSEALNGNREVTAEKVRRFDHMLHDAEQAHRPWATIIMRQARHEGLRNMLKSLAKSEAVTMVDYNGRAVGKSLRIGRRHRDALGREHWQQSLIHDFSWDELAVWLRNIESQINALLINQHMAQRLFALRELYPESFGPAAAAAAHGTSLEDYLGVAA